MLRNYVRSTSATATSSGSSRRRRPSRKVKLPRVAPRWSGQFEAQVRAATRCDRLPDGDPLIFVILYVTYDFAHAALMMMAVPARSPAA
jgi:Cu/Ag efflux pump CusA